MLVQQQALGGSAAAGSKNSLAPMPRKGKGRSSKQDAVFGRATQAGVAKRQAVAAGSSMASAVSDGAHDDDGSDSSDDKPRGGAEDCGANDNGGGAAGPARAARAAARGAARDAAFAEAARGTPSAGPEGDNQQLQQQGADADMQEAEETASAPWHAAPLIELHKRELARGWGEAKLKILIDTAAALKLRWPTIATFARTRIVELKRVAAVARGIREPSLLLLHAATRKEMDLPAKRVW